MAVVFVALAVIAAVVCHGTVLFIPAVITAVLSLWGNGVVWNFRENPQAAPNAAAAVGLLATVAAVILLITGLVIG